MGVLRPKQPFVAPDKDGVKRRFSPDTLIDEKHWVVKGREDLFESAEAAADRAAARPAGRRVGSTETADALEQRPARKAATKKAATKKAATKKAAAKKAAPAPAPKPAPAPGTGNPDDATGPAADSAETPQD